MLCNVDEFVVDDALHTVLVSDDDGASSVGLVSQKTIHDIVASWCWVTNVEDGDLLGGVSMVGASKVSVEGFHVFVHVVEGALISHESILNLEEVRGLSILMAIRELLSDLGLHKLTRWSVLLDCGKSPVATSEEAWNIVLSLNSSLTELTQG